MVLIQKPAIAQPVAYTASTHLRIYSYNRLTNMKLSVFHNYLARLRREYHSVDVSMDKIPERVAYGIEPSFDLNITKCMEGRITNISIEVEYSPQYLEARRDYNAAAKIQNAFRHAKDVGIFSSSAKIQEQREAETELDCTHESGQSLADNRMTT